MPIHPHNETAITTLSHIQLNYDEIENEKKI